MRDQNRKVVLKERPRFQVPTARCFEMISGPVPQAGDRQVLIRTLWLGMDPYLFSRVKQVSSQAKPIPIGEVMYGATVGRIEASNRDDFKVGELVSGLWGWQDYVVSDGAGISRIDPELSRPSHVLGALGAAGFGAWLAVNDVLRVQSGETLSFGAAVGALGQMLGQIGKMKGARIVGVAGSAEKCRIAVQEMGFDACVNHRADDFPQRLREAAAHGIDCAVVSTGGRTFDHTLPNMNFRGRLAVCGLMAAYSLTGLPEGPDRTYMLLNEMLLKRLEFRGSLVLDHLRSPRHEDFKREMKGWILDGAIRPLEHVYDGLQRAPEALNDLFEGRNVGKAVVQVAS